LVFTRRRRVIFVHGCFWHQHPCKLGKRMPKSRLGFWRPKLIGNKARDARNLRALRRLGWRALTLWECQIHPRKLDRLAARVLRFLSK
jgi:DNA mismatch endonuclease (patch repair protein)